MVLSDVEIRQYLKEGRIKIEPLIDPDTQIQAAWVDLRLGPEFRRFKSLPFPYIDVTAKIDSDDYTEPVKFSGDVYLQPDEFILARTEETITVPPDLVACLDGKSSLGRLGIEFHVTSGWVDPGFSGKLVLEVKNVGKLPVQLRPGMRVVKVIFMKLSTPAQRPYGTRKDSKYQGQSEILPSRIGREFE
jgi:dCTP deaminase